MKTNKLLTKAFSAAASKAKKSNFAFSKTGMKTEREHIESHVYADVWERSNDDEFAL